MSLIIRRKVGAKGKNLHSNLTGCAEGPEGTKSSSELRLPLLPPADSLMHIFSSQHPNFIGIKCVVL